ncbi:MAG: hypothetical protein KC933_15335 [Myxococcales bacterium]|nr:hypothetical protein [Myxococcales bacterium]
MNVIRKQAFQAAAVALTSFTVLACGTESAPSITADLAAPATREAKITLNAALDVSVFDQALLDRFVIEDIQLNVADVRLLGADPRIPAGGLVLLGDNQVVQAGGVEAGLEIPFPTRFADDDDLAVYLRIDRTPELGDASVVVRARLYEERVSGGASALSAEVSATDPDGDPAVDPASATDPDGDPASPKCSNSGDATDPDGDPARLGCRRDGLVQRGTSQDYVVVELRDERPADLVTGLARSGASDVVVGIPAGRWLTPEVVAAMEAALDKPGLTRAGADGVEHETLVIHTQDRGTTAGRTSMGDRADDYFLSDGRANSLIIRR